MQCHFFENYVIFPITRLMRLFPRRLPGLESSDLNKSAEDEMYNEMMSSLIEMVTLPLQFMTSKDPSEIVEVGKEKMSIGVVSGILEYENNCFMNEGTDENGNEFDQNSHQRGAVTEKELESDNLVCREGNKNEKVEKDKIYNYAHIAGRERQQWGLWNLVRGPTEGPLQVRYGVKDLWKNIFNWRAYTFKNRNRITVHESMEF